LSELETLKRSHRKAAFAARDFYILLFIFFVPHVHVFSQILTMEGLGRRRPVILLFKWETGFLNKNA